MVNFIYILRIKIHTKNYIDILSDRARRSYYLKDTDIYIACLNIIRIFLC